MGDQLIAAGAGRSGLEVEVKPAKLGYTSAGRFIPELFASRARRCHKNAGAKRRESSFLHSPALARSPALNSRQLQKHCKVLLLRVFFVSSTTLLQVPKVARSRGRRPTSSTHQPRFARSATFRLVCGLRYAISVAPLSSSARIPSLCPSHSFNHHPS